MAPTLLATKVRIPAHPHPVLVRPRLAEALEAGVTRHRLTLVAAPAGYGKTTLLANWAGSSATPVAWLSLSPEDDGAERLLRYLLAAWARIQPAVAEGPLSILLGTQGPNLEAVLAAFVNAADQLPGHQALVLDDYHVLQDPAVHESLAFLLDHLPPRLHVILGTRVDPPLPLARYRARGQLLELGPQDLRFSLDEAGAFLEQSLGLALPPEELQHWQAQLEGWAAGLQLAALSRRHGRPADQAAAAPSGRQRFIADYLSEDVLAGLPPEVSAFLLRTSLLERLTGPLTEALTGLADGQAMLARLEREHLFVQALDEERHWFRYHPLFADFLRQELGRRHGGEVPELHRRAAAWYLAHDLPEPAFEHAVAAGEPEPVLAIIDKYFVAMLNAGELKVLERWIESLPAAWYDLYPVLDLMRAGWLVYTGHFEASFSLVQEIEQRLAAAEGEGVRAQWARVMAVRCFMACTQNDVPAAETYAGRALRDLPEADVGFRPGIYGALGDSYRRNGRWAEARASYLRALDFTSTPTGRLFAAHVYGGLADLELRQGRLQNAAGYWKQAQAAIQAPENWGRLPSPVVGWVDIRLGELLYEWNQLAEAWDHLQRGLERARLGGDVRAMIAGYLIAGRLKLAQGELDAAVDSLEQARPLVAHAEFPDWAARAERLQLEVWLAQGQVRAAAAWAEQRLAGGFEGQPESEATQLAVARGLLAAGDPPAMQQAGALLESLLAAAEAEGRLGVAVEALALLALAHWRRGDGPAALTALERALRLAEPEGYQRLLADLGPPMARLLQEARARHVRPAYVSTLLSAIGSPAAAEPGGQAGLPEPLTERELDVLRLLAAGLTNREIAEHLVISPETVKKHGANIYGKLGASNRTQAVARARALGFIA